MDKEKYSLLEWALKYAYPPIPTIRKLLLKESFKEVWEVTKGAIYLNRRLFYKWIMNSKDTDLKKLGD